MPNDSFRIILDSIRASLAAGNLAIVRASDTSYASDTKNEAFARDIAANASMALDCVDDTDDSPDDVLATTLVHLAESVADVAEAAKHRPELADSVRTLGFEVARIMAIVCAGERREAVAS